MMWVKCLVQRFMGSIVDGGFNTLWRAEYHFYMEVQIKEKQAYRRMRQYLSWAPKVDHDAERQRCERT